MFIIKEISTYETLNMLKSTQGSQTLYGYFWCPLDSTELKKQMVLEINQHHNSSNLEGRGFDQIDV